VRRPQLQASLATRSPPRIWNDLKAEPNRQKGQPRAIVSRRRSPSGYHRMTSQGTAHGRFQRAIHRRHVQAAEMAAREMGGLSLADALLLCELLANADPARYERAALRWLQRFIG
jgi:hypothetical protein